MSCSVHSSVCPTVFPSGRATPSSCWRQAAAAAAICLILNAQQQDKRPEGADLYKISPSGQARQACGLSLPALLCDLFS